MPRKNKKRPDFPSGPKAFVATAGMLEEQRWVYEMRLAHYTYDQISEASEARFGYRLTRSTVARRLHDEWDLRVADNAAKREKLRQLYLDRYDAQAQRLITQLGPTMEVIERIEGEPVAVVVTRPPADRLRAEAELRATYREQAKLLGLDQPIQVEVKTVDVKDIELIGMIEAIRAETPQTAATSQE